MAYTNNNGECRNVSSNTYNDITFHDVDCNNATQRHNCELNKGLVFLKQRDILISTDTWLIVTTIGTDDYDQILTGTEEVFKYLEAQQNNSEIKSLIPIYELFRLKINLNNTRQQVSQLKLLLPNTRPKRGLINAFGSAFKFLFGTLDNGDYEELNSKIENLENHDDTLVHVETDRLTYLKRLTKQVDGNSKAIQLITNNLKIIVHEFANTSTTLWTEIEQVKRKLEYQSRISSLFREIELTLQEVNRQLIQLQESLDVTSNGQLSSILLPPEKLNSILKEVVPKLPTGLSLVINTEIDQIYHYYNLAKVSAIAYKNVIRLFINIPLQSNENQYELYSVKLLPYYDKSLAQFLTIKSDDKYLAVSMNQQKYAVLSESEKNQCMEPPYGVCPISIPLLSTVESSNCAYAMYSGDIKKIKELCQRTIVTNFQTPILYPGLNGHFWVYSVPQTIQVTLHCRTSPNNIKERRIKTIFLTGTGILNNTENCHIFSKYFTLLPHINGKSTANIQSRHIVIPPIESLLTLSEVNEFTNIFNETSINNRLTDLQSIINDSTKADVITIETLQRKLQEIRISQTKQGNTMTFSFHSYLSVLITVFIIMTVGVLTTLCMIRQPYLRRCLVPTPEIRTVITKREIQPADTVVYEETEL